MTITAPKKTGARARLIAAAERLFYTEGIRAVGVDRLCAEAAVSKRSLYQHFSGKDDVVTAMVQSQAASYAERLETAGLPGRERILHVFRVLDGTAASPDARGCPFVGVATELKDREHPAVRVAADQKAALTAYFTRAAAEAGATEPELLGTQLRLLFDGASAYSVVTGSSTPATARTLDTLLDAHGI